MRRRLPVLALGLMLPVSLLAQGDVGGLTIRAARRDSLVARATVTAAFTIANGRDAAVQVLPHVDAPKDWTVLTGAAPVLLLPHESDVLMLSVAVPLRAPSGIYALRLWITSPNDPNGVMDSVVVAVPQRHGLDVGLLERPAFVVSGKPYDAAFLVRNRGNVAARVRLTARSSMGTATLGDTVFALEAEESRVVRARVATRSGVEAAADDVLEVSARNPADTSSAVEASARVTVVPEPSRRIEEYLRVPTQVHLRAASSDGVSPFEVFGAGPIRDRSSTRVDFLMRGPTGPYSAFGERDEYRVEVAAPSWRVRGGDHVYMLSSLMGVGQPGFGGGADLTRGVFTAGGYSQQFRRLPEKGNETGAFVSARPSPDARLAVNFVERVGGFVPGRLGSAAASLQCDSYGGELEMARSQAPDGTGSGVARNARISVNGTGGAFELGHLYADTGFAGTQRGSEHDYFTANTQATEQLSLALNASTHRTDLSRSTGVPYVERFNVGTLGATLGNRYTFEAGAVTRATTVQGVRRSGDQQSLRARGDQDFSFGTGTVEVEGGRATDQVSGSGSRNYTDVSLGLRRLLARGSGAAWVNHYSGGSITKGVDGTVTLGGDASLRVGRNTDLTLMGYATRIQSIDPEWHSQLDAQVAHLLANGSTITFRARLIGGGTLRAADQNVAYLEYGLPLRVPVSRLRTPGRVYGKVVDASTGRGVSGALVRLGPQVAITDARGQVAFGGVPGGEHRVSMSQETSFTDAVFVGDPTLHVDSTRAQPTTFELAVARSARVDISVRRYTAARTGVAGAADSLVDAGPVANATLMLTGERDTLYRTTSDQGTISFTDVPPGKWVITVRGDAPAFTRFDPDRLELTLAPGETRALVFQLVPRKREVQIIGDGQELRPTTVEPRPGAAASPVKTGKPKS